MKIKRKLVRDLLHDPNDQEINHKEGLVVSCHLTKFGFTRLTKIKFLAEKSYFSKLDNLLNQIPLTPISIRKKIMCLAIKWPSLFKHDNLYSSLFAVTCALDLLTSPPTSPKLLDENLVNEEIKIYSVKAYVKVF